MGDPTYATVEAVAGALDIRDTARRRRQIMAALDSASRSAESICDRVFWPRVASRTFDWPQHDGDQPDYRLWLGVHDLADRPTAVTVGTAALTVADLLLWPTSGEPPYEWLETQVSGTESFSSTVDPQGAVVITGPFGYWLETDTAGTVAVALATVDGTTLVVSDPAAIGIGDLIEANNERMIVTGRSWVDSTQDLTGALTVSPADETIVLADAAGFVEDEVILIDSERMVVTEVAGNTLTVERTAQGSTLAAHAVGAEVWRRTSLTVERGAGGTTAVSTHGVSDPIRRWRPPAELATFTLQEAVNTIQQERSGMARTAGAGEISVELTGQGIKDRRGRLKKELGRGPRTW